MAGFFCAALTFIKPIKAEPVTTAVKINNDEMENIPLSCTCMHSLN